MNTNKRRVIAAASVASLIAGNASAQTPDVRDDDEHHDIEEIIVEATALPRTVEQLAQPTAILRGEELAKKLGPSIGETLSGELGLSSTFFGPVSSRPVIRGQAGERVRVLSNNLDVLDASALSEDHQPAVDGILAERVEIIRGPATLLYGSGAAGGLVNVVDNRIVERPLEKALSGKLALNADQALGEEAGAAFVKFGNDRFAAHLDYFRRDTDDYEIPGFAESARLRALEEAEEGGGEEEEEEEAFGRVENSASTAEGAAAALTWTGDRGYVGVSYSGFDSRYGVPAPHEDEHGEEEHGEEEHGMHGEEEEESVSIDLEQRRIDVKGEVNFDGALEAIRFRLAHNDYEHTEFEGQEVGTVFESDGIDGRVELRHRPLAGFEGALGLQYTTVDFNAVGDEAYVPPSDTRRTSLFVWEEFPLSDALTLQGSARAEQQSIDGPAIPLDYDEWAYSMSLGAIWSFSDELSVAANFSSTERHPTSAELYADGPHVAVQRFELGSVTQGDGILDKEHSNTLDLTMRGNTERIDWTATVFVTDARDYVVLLPTAAEEDGFQVFEYAQADAELYGFEAEARIELFDIDEGHLHTRLFSDYVHGERSESGAYLPQLPPLRYGIGLHYTLNAFEASVEAIIHEDQTKTAANELPTDGYTLVNAELSYSMDDSGLFVFLRGSNLGDEEARQHASPLKDIAPLPGRSLQAGLRFEF